MTAYEIDTLVIPEEYKRMSVSEIEWEKERMLKDILSAERPKKEKNSSIVFKL